MKVTRAEKLRSLMATTARQPGEVVDRMRHFAEVRMGRLLTRPPDVSAAPLEEVERELVRRLGGDESSVREEAAAVEREVQERLEQTRRNNPITAVHDGDLVLARLCYLAARLAKPSIVVETGVASGVSSTFLLSALEANGEGRLHSIDLPPLGPEIDDFVGVLVPERLRPRWSLHRGSSRKVLPPLLSQLGQVDLFIHDALHTYWSQRAELEGVMGYLSSGAIVLADDVEDNPAFEEWVARHRPAYSAYLKARTKQGLVGVAVLGD